MGLRVAVTGAGSFLGLALIRELQSRGHECFAIVRQESKSAGLLADIPGIHIVYSDMADTAKWSAQIGRFDVMYHLGWDGVGAEGRANPQIQKKNTEDALACMKAAHDCGAGTFLFAGSQAEYGPRREWTTEETPCEPVIEYGKGKLAMLSRAVPLAEKLGMTYIHMRIFSVYGPGDHPWALVPSCIRCLLENGEMGLSSCTQNWNFLHVRDAARAMVELMQVRPMGKDCIYNVAGTDTRELRSFVEEIHRLTGGRGTLLFGGRGETLEKPFGIMPDISKLLREIDWTPEVTFEEGIRELIALEEKR